MFRPFFSRALTTTSKLFQISSNEYVKKTVPYKQTYSQQNQQPKQLYTARVLAKAPNFKCAAVVDGSFKDISLNDFKGKNVVLFFYPLDFTFVCPTEITALNDRMEEFQALNTEVMAISVDSVNSHLAWTKTPRSEGGLGHTKLPLLSDITKIVSKSYGVLNNQKGISLRGTFIIDKNGILRQSSINDFNIGRNVDEILRLIHAMEHADKYGEVCPVNWKKGENAIKPNPTDAATYFKTIPNNKPE